MHGVNKFWKPFVLENLFSHLTYFKIVTGSSTSLEMPLIFTCCCMRWRNLYLSENRETPHERFSDSIGDDFISHISYWNSMGHFKTLPTWHFCHGWRAIWKLQYTGIRKSLRKIVYAGKCKKLIASFSLCGYQAPEDDFFSVHIRIAGDWTGEVKISLVSRASVTLIQRYRQCWSNNLVPRVFGPFG